MNICIVTQRVLRGDGQGRVNYEVAWEALQRGHSVILLASQIAPELHQYSQIRWIPIATKQFPTQFIQDLVFSVQSGIWLKQHRLEFDVVKVNGAITWVGGDVNAVHFVHSAWLRSPVHVWQRRQDAYAAYQWFYTALNASWERRAFSKAQVVIAVSEQVRQELLEIGVPKDRIYVILNGVDLQEFHPGKVDRCQLGLPEAVTLALFVGDIRSSRKNLDTVLQAIVELPNLHLAVVGSTEGSPYPQLARTLGVETQVHFVGYRRDVAKIMRAADLFVLPSRYEPFGLVLLEALASGLPVITAASAGGAEIVTPNCGIVLPSPDDVQALVQALDRLIRDPDRREQMGSRARLVAEQCSWKDMSRRYIDSFEKLSRC